MTFIIMINLKDIHRLPILNFYEEGSDHYCQSKVTFSMRVALHAQNCTIPSIIQFISCFLPEKNPI